MTDELRKLSGAEEFVSAEIDPAEPLDPDQEKNLRTALEKIAARAMRFLRYQREKDLVFLRPDADIERAAPRTHPAGGRQTGAY